MELSRQFRYFAATELSKVDGSAIHRLRNRKHLDGSLATALNECLVMNEFRQVTIMAHFQFRILKATLRQNCLLM